MRTFEETGHYTFVLGEAFDIDNTNQKQILARLAEFKYIYLSLTAYITAQFANDKTEHISLRIQGTDFLPQLNYADMYRNHVYEHGELYSDAFNSDFESDVVQYKQIHALSVLNSTIYHSEKEQFQVTDHQLAELALLNLNDIRRIALFYGVPIKVDGYKTIENNGPHNTLHQRT